MDNKQKALVLIGAFLVIDSFFVHAIVFDYSKYNLAFLDKFLNHWMIGIALIGIAFYNK